MNNTARDLGTPHLDRLAECIKLSPEPIQIVRVVLSPTPQGGWGSHEYGVAVYRLELSDSLKPNVRWLTLADGPFAKQEDAGVSASKYAREHRFHWRYFGRFGFLDEHVAKSICERMASMPGGEQ
jgi:hypothetical protein